MSKKNQVSQHGAEGVLSASELLAHGFNPLLCVVKATSLRWDREKHHTVILHHTPQIQSRLGQRKAAFHFNKLQTGCSLPTRQMATEGCQKNISYAMLGEQVQHFNPTKHRCLEFRRGHHQYLKNYD